jgi:type VI secretion system secreted protein Hcp
VAAGILDSAITRPGAGDIFLKVKGSKHGLIKGESQDDVHKGEIDVFGWSWGMQSRPSLGGGAASGKATINELRIVKKVDAASTALMLALRQNELLTEAVLTLRKAGKTAHEYLKITIEQGRVTGLSIDAGDGSGSPDLRETVTFSFNKIQVVYVGQGNDGQPLGSMVYEDQFSGV